MISSDRIFARARIPAEQSHSPRLLKSFRKYIAGQPLKPQKGFAEGGNRPLSRHNVRQAVRPWIPGGLPSAAKSHR